MTTHLHFIVWAYDQLVPNPLGQGSSYDKMVSIDLICNSEKEAIARARGLVEKPFYFVQSIIEHFDGQCG